MFIATCNFRGYGTIVIREFLDPGNCTGTCLPDRKIKVTGDVGGLCPNSGYTLSFHKYNCVNCNCKNAGPLLLGDKGIIATNLDTQSDGTLNFCEKVVDDFSIIPIEK